MTAVRVAELTGKVRWQMREGGNQQDGWDADAALSELSALAAQADEYREALEFYADPENHVLTLNDAASGRNSRAVDDSGSRARAALSSLQEGTNG